MTEEKKDKKTPIVFQSWPDCNFSLTLNDKNLSVAASDVENLARLLNFLSSASPAVKKILEGEH